ncbi:NAD(+) diphosphatase [Desulfosporosinus sp. FKA]|uniref:NAD(+) diphosphatase n=1 Tax=Desulfosporosinus sp. FKA TaxID=1969834 RepID=UPI000B4980A3|nr:NAD(+) diphosphatase [Desulfosporosinus sp. FKA]
MYFETRYFSKSDEDLAAHWLLFRENKIVTLNDKLQFTPSEIKAYKFEENIIRCQQIEGLDGHLLNVAELSQETIVPREMTCVNLRQLLGKVPDELFFLAGKASQLLFWDHTHQFCSRCGGQTEYKHDERAKICPACGFVNYPRISPAIIVAIIKGHDILLAKGSRFQGGFYSVLAGFVEPGETFEECVQREVGEEVGIKVKNIKYFGSQPWPFPDSLMVGFTAEYASGDINIDNKEIIDAGWFTSEKLPLIPKTGSIARRLIDWFVESQDKQAGS